MYRIAELFVILLVFSVGNGNSYDGNSITVLDLREYIGEDFTFEDTVISPNGETLAWIEINTGLCLYNRIDGSVECIRWEWVDDGFANGFTNNSAMTLAWSYDSSHLVIAKNFTGSVALLDSDIWLFDVAEREFFNITDDHYSGSVGHFFDYAETEVWVDSFPIWMPNSRDLIFFRSYPVGLNNIIEDRFLSHLVDLEIYRYSIDSASLTLEYTVPEMFSPYMLSPAISSNAMQIALFLFGDTFESFESLSGLWIIDLREDTVRKLVSLSDFRVGYPEWIKDGRFHTGFDSSIQWVANDNGLVVANLREGEDSPFLLNFHYLDVATGRISPLIDLSTRLEPLSDDFYDFPLFGFVSSHRNRFSFGYNSPDSTQLVIESIPLPPEELTSSITYVEMEYQSGLSLNLRVMSEDEHTVIGRNLLLSIENSDSD